MPLGINDDTEDQVNAFKKAQRTAVKLKALFMGPSGSGKTLGALKVAKGLSPKVALIDSENDRSSYYADAVDFDSLSLKEHTPKAYMKAIDDAMEADYEVVVIDSLSHAWQNVLDRKLAFEKANPSKNAFTMWAQFGAEWERLIAHILHADIHVIATARSKQVYEQVEQNGKKRIEKLGMQPQLRDGAEYEFALVFDIAITHTATATKDNTGLFMLSENDNMWDLCAPDVPKRLRAWMDGAAPAVKLATTPRVHGDPITDAQSELLGRLLKSHVFTDEEREKTMAYATTKDRGNRAIESTKAQIAEREAAEKAAKAAADNDDADHEALVEEMFTPEGAA